MKRCMIIGILMSTLPLASAAQELPLYIDHGGELSFSGTMLDEASLNDMFAGRGIVDTFGVPEIIVKDAKTGASSPVYASPEEYEMVFGADGVVAEKHDDMTFAEDEGSDLREDLDFAEGEGLDTREDITFTADDALKTDAVFDGPKDFFTGTTQTRFHPQHGTWGLQMAAPDISGCPQGVGEMVAAQAIRSASKDVIFSHPGWVPADLNADYASLHWVESGTNGFHAEPYRLEVDGSGMSLSVTFALAARSETRIDVWGRVLMKLTPVLAQMAGGSEVCTAIVAGAYTKTES